MSCVTVVVAASGREDKTKHRPTLTRPLFFRLGVGVPNSHPRLEEGVPRNRYPGPGPEPGGFPGGRKHVSFTRTDGEEEAHPSLDPCGNKTRDALWSMR